MSETATGLYLLFHCIRGSYLPESEAWGDPRDGLRISFLKNPLTLYFSVIKRAV